MIFSTLPYYFYQTQSYREHRELKVSVANENTNKIDLFN